MRNIRLGDYNTLTVVKEVDFGLYLDGYDDGEILLPTRYVPEGTKVGDMLEVFIYLDQDERLIATTLHPLAKTGDFAYLEVAWVNQHGAFLDWGLMKDLFCPFREQKKKMEKGMKYIVHVHLDDESYRMMASAKVEHFIDPTPPAYSHNECVDLLIWQKTDLGFKAIVDNRYQGLIYKDQIYDTIHTGDRMKGYVNQVRSDGKIDIMLQPTGRQHTIDFADTLLDYIIAHQGFCPYGDKTDADVINRIFKVSKKTFKRAIGDLYKRRVIEIDEKGISLVG